MTGAGGRRKLAGAAFWAAWGLASVAGAAGSSTDFSDRLGQAWTEFRLEEYLQARYQFRAIADGTPKESAWHRMALYGLATTLALQRPDPDQPAARKLYDEVVALDGTGDLAAWSLLGEARMLHVVPVGEDPDYAKVREAYQQVITKFPDHPAGEEALIFQQSTLVASLKPDDATAALKTLSAFVVAHPKAKFLSPAWTLIAECHHTLGHPADQLAAEIKALDTFEIDPTNPFMDKALNYWRIATLAEFQVGDFATARKYYKLLAKEYPTDQRRYGAEAALKRMDDTERRLKAGG